MTRRRSIVSAALALAAVAALASAAFLSHAADAPPKPAAPSAQAPPPGAPKAGAPAPGGTPPAGRPGPPPAPRKPPAPGEKAESYYKNIQSFKGVPADQIIPAMQFMSAALGVDCEFCHVERAPEKDDKEEKVTAREMIKMTNAINRDSFEGHKEVSCFSCHHGVSHPQAVPAVATADDEESEPEPPPTPPSARPSVDAVLEKYTTALGGGANLAKVTSRVMKGSISGFGPQPLSLEVTAKAPDKRMSVVKTPMGENVNSYAGGAGWVGGTGRPPQDMSEAELLNARIDAAFPLATQLKGMFDDVRVAGRPGKIDGKEAVRVFGRSKDKPPVEFWFDAESGLLVRTMRYEDTPVGRNPTQTDYSDYRTVDGVKVPYQWVIARPGRRFTVKIDEAKQNVPVEDSKFKKPEAP